MQSMQTGQRDHGGYRTQYDLYIPVTSFPAPFVLLIHGFAAHRGTLRGHAERLCAKGFVVLNANMSTLFAPTLEAAQQRNIQMAAAHVEWALQQPAPGGAPGGGATVLVDRSRVGLAGHSAGGAVVLEAAVELRSRGVAVARLCLLDGVPWPRTLGAAGRLLVPGGAPPPRVLSLRSDPGAWNMRGRILEALRAAKSGGGGDAPLITDALIAGSGHGDPICPPQRGLVVKLMGLLGPPRCAELYSELLDAFLQGRESEALAAAGALVQVAAV
jgi:hypothetical protein